MHGHFLVSGGERSKLRPYSWTLPYFGRRTKQAPTVFLDPSLFRAQNEASSYRILGPFLISGGERSKLLPYSWTLPGFGRRTMQAPTIFLDPSLFRAQNNASTDRILGPFFISGAERSKLRPYSWTLPYFGRRTKQAPTVLMDPSWFRAQNNASSYHILGPFLVSGAEQCKLLPYSWTLPDFGGRIMQAPTVFLDPS